MHDVACEFARAAVPSKDAQKQLARTSLNEHGDPHFLMHEFKLQKDIYNISYFDLKKSLEFRLRIV